MAYTDVRRNALLKVKAETEGLELYLKRCSQGLFSFKTKTFKACNISECNVNLRYSYSGYKKKICTIIGYAKYYIYKVL